MSRANSIPAQPGKLLTHPRFERGALPPQKRRRGRLPGGVARIHFGTIQRFRPGVLAEVIKPGVRVGDRNVGARVLITKHDPGHKLNVEAKGIDRDLFWYDSKARHIGKGGEVWFDDSSLRRVWRGLSDSDRIKLRLWRAS